MSPAELRIEYTKSGLLESDAGDDPIDLFGRWFHEAIKSEQPEPTAMTLATVTETGQPSARIVLLKSFDHEGFCFFTNYLSRKARDLAAHPAAALVFFWQVLERQVRIEGPVEKVSDKTSDHYFASRPRGSQLGAWASPQSKVIPNREVLETRQAEFAEQFGESIIPRPPHWGGYRIVPSAIEFWQGRPNRLHDRLRYTLQTNGQWLRERLGP